jgi:hypothetical protein
METTDRGSRVGAGAPVESVGIPGAVLERLPSGNFSLTSDAKLPPDPEEVIALLAEFIPSDWSCYEETSDADHDVAYYGPDEWSSRAAPVVPRPRPGT